MTAKNFSSTFEVSQTPAAVFNAITNVRGWWSEDVRGNSLHLGDVFDYQYEDIHRCKIELIEVVPNEKMVWRVLENYFNFTEDQAEWTDDTITFDIIKKGDTTQLIMTHFGLVPQCECYDACNEGWTHYIQTSLKSLIETGKGMPNAKGTARTPTEKKLSGNDL